MCWLCPDDLENDHDGNPGAITTDVLHHAAAMAGTDIPGAVSKLVLALSHFDPALAKEREVVVNTTYAAVRLVKSAPERQFTLGVAYPAMKADITRAADGHRDFVSVEVLEKTAHTWLQKYGDVNLFHKAGTSGHFTPAESYIWPAEDWVTVSPVDGSVCRVSKGDWVLGGYWDDEGWQLVKAGLVNGWSPEGTARRTTPSKERLALLRG